MGAKASKTGGAWQVALLMLLLAAFAPAVPAGVAARQKQTAVAPVAVTTVADFAAELIRRAASDLHTEWRYDAPGGQLLGPHQERIALTNLFLQYRAAAPDARPGLMGKYLQVLRSMSIAMPERWQDASDSLYVVVRGGDDRRLLKLTAKADDPKSTPLDYRFPFNAPLELRIVYDTGPSMMIVSRKSVAGWGVSDEQVLAAARRNLQRLPMPTWIDAGDGVYQLESGVSYEESMLLRLDVRAALPGSGAKLFLISNRGVLYGTGDQDPSSLVAMLKLARTSLEDKPWPLPPVLLKDAADGLLNYRPVGEAGRWLKLLSTVNQASVYADQKQALDELYQRQGTDLFVARQLVTAPDSDSLAVTRRAVWTEGVDSLLPEADSVLLIRHLKQKDQEIVEVPWQKLRTLCGGLIENTDLDPVRWRVRRFPDAPLWAQLKRAGVSR